MTVLVIAEHEGATVKAATLHVVTAALACASGEVHALVAGAGAGEAASSAARIAGVTRVIVAQSPSLADNLAENLGAQILSMAPAYSHIVFAASAHGKNVAPRVAALLDVAQVSEITRVVAPDIFERPVYAGNVIATVQSSDSIKVLTVRTSSFIAAAASGGSADVQHVEGVPGTCKTTFIGREHSKSERPELGAAQVIVAGGRGLGSAANFMAVLAPLADKLNAGLGASLAAVEDGFAPNDWQVGQSGRIVAPELYIACGISGSVQHLTGIRDAKVIVAINSDEEAPIFELADYGLVADLFVAVPELIAALETAGKR
ncbi:FAD-binding protein [Variovorax robiniae]|uniref:FAD-binding protein n=1 Tax=Variovorax robiniae TaxID=1836199 RepID=A0ABU8XBR3_9BURK